MRGCQKQKKQQKQFPSTILDVFIFKMHLETFNSFPSSQPMSTANSLLWLFLWLNPPITLCKDLCNCDTSFQNTSPILKYYTLTARKTSLPSSTWSICPWLCLRRYREFYLLLFECYTKSSPCPKSLLKSPVTFGFY